MKLYGRNGLIAGIFIGIPLTLYNNPNGPLAEWVGNVMGTMLVCWALGIFIGRYSKYS